MKKIKYLAPVMALAIMPMSLSPLALTSCNSNDSLWQLTNPDGSLAIDINLSNEGQLTYSVKKNKKDIVNKSVLGMSFTQDNKTYDFSKGLTYVKTTTDEKEFSYDSISGKTSHINVHYKEKVITTKIDDLFMDVTFRALNDGYGFQYSFYKENNEQDVLTWLNEFSEFNIPFNSLTYGMDYEANRQGDIDYYSYETHYMVRDSKNIDDSTIVSMPFGYETNGYYSFITESGLMGSGYHGSFLKRDETGPLAIVDSPAGGSQPDHTITLPFTSPWRVSSVGNYATSFETTIVEDIQGDIEEYKPSQQPDFDYDWVEPGLTSWSWLRAGGDGDFETQMKYVDLSKAMGWKYVLLDAGWEAMDDAEGHLTTLINHATHDEPKIKVLVWVDAKKEPFLSDMDGVLQSYEELGISGVKVDFWDGQAEKPIRLKDQMEDKQTIEQYDKFYQLAAKHHMVVNCHGCNKPTGERRKYPNVINREAIRGNEMHNVYAGQGVLHAFTRGIVGPTDFTPVVMPLQHDVTIGYQMALGILYESGTPSMADLPATYINEDETDTPYTDYYKHLPASWDQSKFIKGNPETYVVIARRKGDNWWLAGITTTQRVINLDFSFLGNGTYDAIIYNGGDRGDETDDAIEKSTDTITRNSKRAIQVTDNAGFVIELRKQ